MAFNYIFLAIFCFVGAAHCFEWTNCGDPAGPIEFNVIDLAPSPLVFPGDAIINFDAVSKNTIDNFNAAIDITKYIIGIPIPIPCVNDIGSCTYEDVCGLLASNSTIAEIIRQILEAVGLPTSCPLPPGDLVITDLTIPLPTIPAEIAPLVVGRYVIRVDMTEFTTNEQLACIELDFEIEVV